MQGRHLGLSEPVADRAAPGLAHAVDDLGVQRLARSTSSRGGWVRRARSAWINIRHTVGGAQNVDT